MSRDVCSFLRVKNIIYRGAQKQHLKNAALLFGISGARIRLYARHFCRAAKFTSPKPIYNKALKLVRAHRAQATRSFSPVIKKYLAAAYKFSFAKRFCLIWFIWLMAACKRERKTKRERSTIAEQFLDLFICWHYTNRKAADQEPIIDLSHGLLKNNHYLFNWKLSLLAVEKVN